MVRLISQGLEDLAREDQAVLAAGLETARWITVDDTSARHGGQDSYVTTQLGDNRFAVFRTGPSKSRGAFLSILQAGRSDYLVDEAALWGAVEDQGRLAGTVIVSDGARQFCVADHALCWVHAERLIYRLQPANPAHRKAVETTRAVVWWFYRDLKAYKQAPDPKRARMMRARFDRIFTKKTGYILLDQQLERLYRRKGELLRVLDRPEIPLHTNGLENDIRSVVTKRKISGGTVTHLPWSRLDV